MKTTKAAPGGTRAGAGRPTKYNPTVASKICNALVHGATRTGACAYADISMDTFTRWMKEYSEFADAVQKSEGRAEVYFSSVITSASKEHWQAAAWWLARRRPDEWREKKYIDADFALKPGSAAVTISPAELDRRVKELSGIDSPSAPEPADDEREITQ